MDFKDYKLPLKQTVEQLLSSPPILNPSLTDFKQIDYEIGKYELVDQPLQFLGDFSLVDKYYMNPSKNAYSFI